MKAALKLSVAIVFISPVLTHAFILPKDTKEFGWNFGNRTVQPLDPSLLSYIRSDQLGVVREPPPTYVRNENDAILGIVRRRFLELLYKLDPLNYDSIRGSAYHLKA